MADKRPDCHDPTGLSTFMPPRDVEKSQNNESELTARALGDEYSLPTEDESQTLRRVAGTLPLVSFSLCLVEFAERASYYGAKTVFSNFIQFPLPEGTKWSFNHASGY